MNAAIRLELDHGIARVTLARPGVHNAFDDDVIAQLTEALQAAEADSEVRAVVLSGDGPTFSSCPSVATSRRGSTKWRPARSTRLCWRRRGSTGWGLRRGMRSALTSCCRPRARPQWG